MAPPPNENAISEERKRLNELYFEERKVLLEGAKNAADTYSKFVVAISGGGLGLSVTFVTDLAPSPLPASVIFLKSSWICFAASLVILGLSWLLSQYGFFKQIRVYSSELRGTQTGGNGMKNIYVPFIILLHILSFVGLLSGIVLFVIFGYVNYDGNIAKAAESTVDSSFSKEIPVGIPYPSPIPPFPNPIPEPPPIPRP